jgi:hypothetical protein
LIAAVLAELGLLSALLYVPSLAQLLGHAGPSIAGFTAAALAIPAVLSADALHKRFRRQASGTSGSSRSSGMRHRLSSWQ